MSKVRLKKILLLDYDSFRILMIKRHNPHMTVSEIADKTGFSIEYVWWKLKALEEAGISTRGRFWCANR